MHCRADGGGIPWWGRPWAAKITAGCWADWKEPCGRAELRHRGLFDEGCLHFYAGALGDERSDADTELLRRLLELQPGMEVLDLACGHGRIANRLAARGCRVTGLDATPLFLDLACRDATDRGVAVEYVQGDAHAALDRPLRPGHQLVHRLRLLQRRRQPPGPGRGPRALKPGGRLALEVQHRDWIVGALQPSVVVERDGDLLVDRNRFELLTGRIVSERMIVRGGRVRRVRFFVRLFGFTELRDWLLAAGLPPSTATTRTAPHCRRPAAGCW